MIFISFVDIACLAYHFCLRGFFLQGSTKYYFRLFYFVATLLLDKKGIYYWTSSKRRGKKFVLHIIFNNLFYRKKFCRFEKIHLVLHPDRWFLKQYSVNFRRKPSGNSPFPAGTRREVPGIRHKNPVTVSGCRFWQVPVGSGRNRINPVTGSVHRNTVSMKSPEYHGTGCFLPYVFDLGIDSIRKRRSRCYICTTLWCILILFYCCDK